MKNVALAYFDFIVRKGINRHLEPYETVTFAAQYYSFRLGTNWIPDPEESEKLQMIALRYARMYEEIFAGLSNSTASKKFTLVSLLVGLLGAEDFRRIKINPVGIEKQLIRICKRAGTLLPPTNISGLEVGNPASRATIKTVAEKVLQDKPILPAKKTRVECCGCGFRFKVKGAPGEYLIECQRSECDAMTPVSIDLF